MIAKPLHSNTPDTPAPPGAQVEVWTVDLQQGEAFIEAAVRHLSQEERERVPKFTNAVARRNFVTSHGALRRLLSQKLGLPADQIPIHTGPQGKPLLAGELGGQLHFNLSHSGGLGLVALSERTEVGVDVECVRPVPDAMRLARRFFSGAEAAALQERAELDRPAAFFRVWTRKEAVLKATGLGIGHGLGRYEVSCEVEGGLLRVDGDRDGAAEWTLHSWSPMAGYLAAVAVRLPEARFSFHECPVNIS